MKVSCKNIPTYDHKTDEWSTTSFDNQLEFGEFLLKNCFKEPGEYNFHKDIHSKWNEAGRIWTKNKRYTDYAEGTTEYYEFWDNEELKSRLGVIWKNGDDIWYTTRDYYFLINYCPIVNKEQGYTETFCDIRDGQYHMMLYEKIAEIFHQHSGILKRRQFLFSFCHVAKTVNYLYFENRKRLKWFASDESYIDDVNGSWSILNQYKTHLNNHTDWYRSFSPDKGGEIQQRQQIKKRGKWEWEGNESSVVAKTLNKDPKKGVGGPTFWAWYEEGGIAPTADITLQFMEPALTSGLSRVGSFCIGGSVGDLDECKPLEQFIKYPSKYGFFKVPTKWYDETGVVKECGLFIPAQYSMPEATDEHGNSDVELALKLLHKAEFEGFKAGEYGKIADEEAWINLPPKDYILKKSQNPKNIKEAFAWRNVSFYNVQRIERRQKTLKIQEESGNLELHQGLLEVNKDGKIVLKPLSSFSILDKPSPMGFPVDEKLLDKRGCVTIHEFPDDDPEPGMFFAGVDSVEVGYTETSPSLFSIYIYKRGCTEIKVDANGKNEMVFKRGKLVASYTGRFKNPKDHNEQGLLLLRMYKALAACERNRPNFINYCRDKGFSHLIARRSELPFNKDLDVTGYKNDEFGIYSGNTGELEDRIKKALYEHIDSEIEVIRKESKDDLPGDIVKTIRGYDNVDDYWLLEELKLYNEDGNFDRFIAAGLAVILGRSRELDHDKTVYTKTDINEKEEVIKRKSLSVLPQRKKIYRNLLGR